MTSKANTIDEYLNELPADRLEAIAAVRKVILANLPKGFEERMQYGMISYVVPHSLFPAGYHTDPKQPLPYASLASQKNYMALYVLAPNGDPELDAWFREEYANSGKKLDMGKSCVRFKHLSDLPLELVGQLIARVPVESYIARYQQELASRTLSAKK